MLEKSFITGFQNSPTSQILQNNIGKGKEISKNKSEHFQAESRKAQADLMAKARQNAELKLDLSKVGSKSI